MGSRFAALADEAGEHTPMSTGTGTVVPGRVLLADGDGLAYYCAGNEDTSPGEARNKLQDKLRDAAQASGSERIRILLTGRGSHKGFRFAVARVKPYQGQRDKSYRPKNWPYLRQVMESAAVVVPGVPVEVQIVTEAEADDLFSRYAATDPNCVIYTQDKDMRMVPGWHLNWLTHIMFYLKPGTWAQQFNDELYGRAWFWSQMLHGDDADHVPGLPFYTTGELVKSGPNRGKVKEIRCGEKSTAVVQMLPEVSSDMGACILLQGLYSTCYGDRWLVEMLEQAVLLWMRTDDKSDPFDVTAPGNPLHPLTTHALFPAAKAEIEQRIKDYIEHEKAQNHGSGEYTGTDAGEAAVQMCSMSATVPPGSSSAGSRSFNGTCESDLAPRVQCPAGEGREQLQAVRGSQPRGFPSWSGRLLAKTQH